MMKIILAKRLKRIAEELEESSRKAALANFLGVEPDDIQDGYDEYHFDVPGEGEFAVYTDDEADNEFARQMEEFIDEMGISGFSKNFQEQIKSSYLNENWFCEALEELDMGYCEDIASEPDGEFGNRLVHECYDAGLVNDEDFDVDENGDPDFSKCNKYADELTDLYVEWRSKGENCVERFRNELGDEELDIAIKENNLLDSAKIIEAVKESDGRGPTLAPYDGNENENGDYFIYRVG